MMNSTSRQRQLIGYFRKLLKIPAEVYYDELEATYHVSSSKELNYSDAGKLINKYKEKATQFGLYKSSAKKEKYEHFAIRDYYMATPKQLKMIEAMWKQVSFQNSDSKKEKSLNRFIKRITGKEHIHFIEKSDVSRLVKALEKMLEEKNQKNTDRQEVQYANV